MSFVFNMKYNYKKIPFLEIIPFDMNTNKPDSRDSNLLCVVVKYGMIICHPNGMLSLCVIGDLCHLRISCLNFVGILKLSA